MTDERPPAFINLDRTFSELSNYARESDDVDVSQAFRRGSPLTWAELRMERRVVLLAEAGAGKTEEIRNAAETWRSNGDHAFFLRLEHVADDLDTAFEVGDLDAFERWRKSQDEGWVLLDSVDEARLRGPSDFEKAIRKFAARVRGAEDRLHLLVTSRISAWRPKTDLEFCERQLPLPAAGRVVEPGGAESAGADAAVAIATKPAEDNTRPGYRMVTIDDLDTAQITKFAQAYGIADLGQLLDAVERKDAWAYTRRPQDLVELIEFWRAQGRIGSRLELVKSSVARRLAERDQTRAEWQLLAADCVHAAAARIAAACILTNQATIQVPDGSASGSGLRLAEVLPDWDPRQLHALLSRPLFDAAIYGAVRFHHREAREYLAAEWFAGLLRRETSRLKIESLFFRHQYDLDLVVPALRPVLPWLALLDDGIRDRLLKSAPEVLFEGGDPSQLPTSTRERILRECCRGLAATNTPRTFTDRGLVQRFAAPDLVEAIRDLFRVHADSDDVASFLCRMIWIGPLPGLRPEARSLALAADASQYTRIVAVRALAAIGAVEDVREVRTKVLIEGKSVDRDLLAELVKANLSEADDVAWLVEALRAAAAPRRHAVDGLTYAIKEIIERASPPMLRALAAAFEDLLAEAPHVNGSYSPISKTWACLAVPAGEALARLADQRDAALLEEPMLTLLRRVGLAKRHHSDLDELKSELGAIVRRWETLSRRLFWHEVMATRATRAGEAPTPVTHFRDVWPCTGFWGFGAADFDYFLGEISARGQGQDRAVAFSLVIAIFNDAARPEIWLERLKCATAGDAMLGATLGAFLDPPPETEQVRKWREQDEARKRKADGRRIKEARNRREWREGLQNDVERVRDSGLDDPPQVSRNQWYLLNHMRDAEGQSNRWVEGHWEKLIDEFGTEVAEAFRDGARGFWRRYDALTRSTGGTPNSTPAAHVFGLAGLAIEARDGEGWTERLSPDEAEQATRYAVGELNGFPNWLPGLFVAHPDAVCSVLLREIVHQVRTERPDEPIYYVLDDVSWSGLWCWEALGPRLLSLLGTVDPCRADTLKKLLIIVHGSMVCDQAIIHLAARAVDECASMECRAIWFASLIGVDPEQGVLRLRKYLEGLNEQNDRTRFAMHVVTHLVGGRHGGGIRPRHNFVTARHLGDLYALMHEHIRRAEDVDRTNGGVYSPELRDDAQDGREGLLGLLDRIPGKASFLALTKLAEAHPEESLRPYLRQRARRRAEADADLSPWTTAQVCDFADLLERTPRDHRELADLVLLHLLDLKAELEGGDESRAPLLSRVQAETEMRNFLAGDLRSRGRGRYHVPQESELADGKRPDLRFHGNGFDAPVPAELKLADRWTGPKLLERLENQLCGDYLRDSHSRRGFFVVVHSGVQQKWELGGGQRVDFEGLVKALADRWSVIAPNFPDIDDIQVIGINLPLRTKRAPKGSAARSPLPENGA